MAVSNGCQQWLSAMAVSNGCQQWLSAMAVSNGCQQWLSAMVFPPKTTFFGDLDKTDVTMRTSAKKRFGWSNFQLKRSYFRENGAPGPRCLRPPVPPAPGVPGPRRLRPPAVSGPRRPWPPAAWLAGLAGKRPAGNGRQETAGRKRPADTLWHQTNEPHPFHFLSAEMEKMLYPHSKCLPQALPGH